MGKGEGGRGKWGREGRGMGKPEQALLAAEMKDWYPPMHCRMCKLLEL